MPSFLVAALRSRRVLGLGCRDLREGQLWDAYLVLGHHWHGLRPGLQLHAQHTPLFLSRYRLLSCVLGHSCAPRLLPWLHHVGPLAMADLHAEARLIACHPEMLLLAVPILLALLRELKRLTLRYLVAIRPHQFASVALNIFVDRGQFVIRGVDRLLLA